MLIDWRVPTSIVEADERKRIIVAEVQEIQAQLGDRARREAGGGEYWEWHKKAVWSMTYRLQELRLIKKWKREELYREASEAS